MRSPKTQKRDVVIDAILEKNDKLELVTDDNESLTVSKRLFQDNFDNMQEVALPFHATVMEQDGAVVEFITGEWLR